MPTFNGLELLKRIKSSSPNVRTILMSAYNLEFDELYQRYMDEGIIDSSIEKPGASVAISNNTRAEVMKYTEWK